MIIDNLSPSSYDCYSQCEWKWFLNYNCKFTDTSGASALMGTMGHKVFEILSRASMINHPKESKIWDIKYLWRSVYSHYKNTNPEVEFDDKKLKVVCKGMSDLLNSTYTPVRQNTIDTEVRFNIKLPEPEFKLPNGNQFTIRGVIDRVDKLSDTSIEIIDYKSGTSSDYEKKDRPKKTNLSLLEMIQPRMYHLAAKTLYPWAKDILVTFHYFTDGGPLVFPFSDSDLVVTKEILKKRFKAIQHNNDPQRNKSWKCKVMCGYGKNDMFMCNSLWAEKSEVGLEFMRNKYVTLNYTPFRKRK